MLTLNDGRADLWQWDTGRTLAVDADCSQVHFSNKVFGRSIDVDVIDGTAIIPDILLQTDKDLNVWAFVGTAENGYTKISKTFKVNRRNKPADYVFTPTEQTTLAELSGRLDRIEESQDPDAIKNAVDDYLKQNPVEVPVQSVNGQTGAVELNAEDVGAISQGDLQAATNEALAQAKASGEFDGADGKSAYAYAVEGGYTGTEAEFAAKLAAEKFANPNALTFTGAVTGSYDGSAALSVEIPTGGSSGSNPWRLITDLTLAEDVATFEITTDDNGNAFEVDELFVITNAISTTSTAINADFRANGKSHIIGTIPCGAAGADQTVGRNMLYICSLSLPFSLSGTWIVTGTEHSKTLNWLQPKLSSFDSRQTAYPIGTKIKSIEVGKTPSAATAFAAGSRFVFLGR